MGKSTSSKAKKTPDKAADRVPLTEKFSLAKPSNPKCSPGKLQNMSAYVKMFLVPIGSAKGYGLFLKRDGTPPWSAWADKIMFEMVRGVVDGEWTHDLNIYDVTFELHQNDTLILNKKRWAVRVYIGFSSQEFTRDILLHIAQCVAKNINATGELKDNQQTLVDPDTFLETMDASWCDYLGNEGAKKLARRVVAEDPEELGRIFHESEEEFHCFWKSGQISLNVARAICLPPSMSTEIRDLDVSD